VAAGAAGDRPRDAGDEGDRGRAAEPGAARRLGAVERAVLVLRDVFDLEYAEIADILEKTPANVRQIASRARDHAGDTSRRQPVSEEERQRLATAFLTATASGDVGQLQDLLAADAIMYTDGGGVVTAARKPIYGAEKIARFMVRVQRKDAYPDDPVFTPVLVNGDPGMRMDSASEGFLSIVAVEVADGSVQSIRFFNNPERFPVEFPTRGESSSFTM
jgi:RNA polymerase sigma-70 factor, ECF subfamily